MEKPSIKRNKLLIESLARKYNWILQSEDKNTYRLTYMSESGKQTIDVYASKMTVCIHYGPGRSTFVKRASQDLLTEILIQPEKFEKHARYNPYTNKK